MWGRAHDPFAGAMRRPAKGGSSAKPTHSSMLRLLVSFTVRINSLRSLGWGTIV